MRINAFNVEKYGPLTDTGRNRLGNLVLVYGSNEDGKTLLLDSIVRLLFSGLGRHARGFGNMRRVSVEPEGYVVVTAQGHEIKLGRGDSLHKHMSLAPIDFRNVFVIRDSDLGLEKAGDYITHISERLTGMQTREIEKLKKVIQKRGRLASARSDSKLTDREDAGHARTTVEAAKSLLEELRALEAELERAGFDGMDMQLYGQRAEIDRLEAELEALTAARRVMRFRRAQKTVAKLQQVHSALDDLAAIHDAGFDSWRQHELECERLQIRIGESRGLLSRLREDARENDREVRNARADVERLSSVLDDVQEKLQPRIAAASAAHLDAARSARQEPVWRATTSFLFAIALLSVVALILRPLQWLPVLAGGCAIAGLVCAALWWKARQTAARAFTHELELRRAAAALGIDISDHGDLVRVINEYRTRTEAANTAWQDAELNDRSLSRETEMTAAGLEALQNEHSSLRDQIDRVRLESGVANVAEYGERLMQKRELEKQKQLLRGQLSAALETDAAKLDLATCRAVVERELRNTEDVTAADGVDGDEEALRAQLKRLRAKQGEVRQRWSDGRDALRDAENRLHRMALFEEPPRFRTSAEVNVVARRVESFINDVLQSKDDAGELIAVLEEIEAEEKAKIIRLFGEDRAVARNFRRITDGAYDDVTMDPETGEIQVRTRDRQWLSADVLSGGTFDQLFFAIRLSFAESLLGKERGFFLFDDPFVKSDSKRLAAQVQLLRRLSQDGWQVFLFSAKKEIRDAFRADIESQTVDVLQLGGADSTPAEPGRPREQPALGDLFGKKGSY